jgi:hypothetical protein
MEFRKVQVATTDLHLRHFGRYPFYAVVRHAHFRAVFESYIDTIETASVSPSFFLSAYL